jgi:nitroreductase
LEVFEAIKSRRSVRAFTEERVSDEDLLKLLGAARMAPSAGNIQPWSFVVVKASQIKKRLAEAALNQHFIEEAPVVIVACADEERSKQGYGSRGEQLYCIQDTAAAVQNMLLAAVALGLGACWVGAFHENEVRDALNIPAGLRPVAIIPVGWPDEQPQPRFKRSLEDIVVYEAF